MPIRFVVFFLNPALQGIETVAYQAIFQHVLHSSPPVYNPEFFPQGSQNSWYSSVKNWWRWAALADDFPGEPLVSSTTIDLSCGPYVLVNLLSSTSFNRKSSALLREIRTPACIPLCETCSGATVAEPWIPSVWALLNLLLTMSARLQDGCNRLPSHLFFHNINTF